LLKSAKQIREYSLLAIPTVNKQKCIGRQEDHGRLSLLLQAYSQSAEICLK
jgi:hypothetical protein